MILILSLVLLILYLSDISETIKDEDLDHTLKRLLKAVAVVSILVALIANY